ncbi:hypothetical protein MCP04_31025 (plasmid) [Leptolyngbya boryana IU 594]|nr:MULTISPECIES: hypothetical protein [Leptolyngbya]MBD2372961.1 hypothetical protein [Leptolyngbya sp. FACHB-238]MBD2397286.1 hypothetical protein [Leptolyngbya sp. FACHB-239]ULP33205.1 hypothetical protein MCP04_31025 [Leptolyngbya boryana IU 594]
MSFDSRNRVDWGSDDGLCQHDYFCDRSPTHAIAGAKATPFLGLFQKDLSGQSSLITKSSES